MIELFECKSDKFPSLFEIKKSDVAQYLFDNVDWNLVFSVMLSLKRKYNTGAETFVKADIVAEAIEAASDYKIEYIDEIGCDFYIKDLKIYLEMKSTNLNIFPKNGKNFTPKLKLKNFRSLKNIDNPAIEKTFDYLLLLEPLTCGIVSFENILPYLEIFSDGIGTKVNVNDVEFIKQVYSVKNTNICLFDRYEQMKKQIIQDVKENLYGDLIKK
jgi:hypothetical protein